MSSTRDERPHRATGLPKGRPATAWAERGNLTALVARGEDTLRALLQETARASLWLFLTDVLFHPDIECSGGICCERKRKFYEPLHKPWCDWAQDDSVERKMLLAPRGHFKSTVISFAKVCFDIIRNPNVRVLLVSSLEGNAINFCRQVKGAFLTNERLRWLFPEWCPDPMRQFGSEQSFISPARTNMALAAHTFTAAHIDAALASQHYDKIVMDDPIEARHVATEEQAAKARACYNKIVPLLDPSTPGNPTSITVVGTRWAYYDLYAGLLPIDMGGNAATTVYSAIVRSALEDKSGKADFAAGDPIFPTRFPRTTLIRLLDEARADDRLGESFWWMQYMNICQAPSERAFQEEWFVEVDGATLPPLFAKMIVVDTALKDDTVIKKGARGDYTCILVGGWDREGRLYVLDGLRSQNMTSRMFTDALVAYSQRYNTPTVVKQRAGEDTIGSQIRDAFSAAMTPLDYRPIILQGLGRKIVRIKEALQGPMNRAELYWVKWTLENARVRHHPLLEQARKELLNLGQYPVDDVADTLANFYHPTVRFARQNLVGGGSTWKIPGSPLPQLSNNMYNLWQQSVGSTPLDISRAIRVPEGTYTPRVGLYRRGAGFVDPATEDAS